MSYASRIREYRTVNSADLQRNPLNFRRHPETQRAALRGLLSSVGRVAPLLAYEDAHGALICLDGHARLDESDEWDVAILDIDEHEAATVLAMLDKIGADAEIDPAALLALLDTLPQEARQTAAGAWSDDELAALLEAGADQILAGGSGAAPVTPTQARATLAERFGVPPFSVLDARQGYWQTRKRAWIALGIQSELGRGENALDMLAAMAGITDPDEIDAWNEARRESPRRMGGSPPHGPTVTQNPDGTLNYRSASRDKWTERTSPGGSRRDAASLGADGKTVRGDGKGRRMALDVSDTVHRLKPSADQARKHSMGRAAASAFGSGAPGTLAKGYMAERYNADLPEGTQSGTSIFDPVLCELVYRWFCPEGGAILDPFAGGSVRGIVASLLGRAYTGVDLRPEQIAANEAQAGAITPDAPPHWIVGDSRDVAELAPAPYDLIFSCPPYADLEVYSDDPRDLSTLEYAAFVEAYRAIIAASVAMLNDNRFAVFVVGDVRDKKGFYRNFVGATVDAFQNAGATLYNEAILVTAVGSLPIRIAKQFEGYRKLGKTHQNVLCFFKGDPKRIKDFGPVEMGEGDIAEQFGEVLE